MPRLSDLDHVMFQVDERAVYVACESADGVRHVAVPGTKAIVNVDTGRVLGVVGGGYRLVTNEQALQWGRQCSTLAFPETQPEEWVVSEADAPSSGTYCCIDLVHNSGLLDFDLVSAEHRPDAYGPFVRIINSYNGLRSLSFAIGLHRKVCSNGLIVPHANIRISFVHGKRQIREGVDFKMPEQQLETLRSDFAHSIAVLRTCEVAREQRGALIRGALSIREPARVRTEKKVAEEWTRLLSHVDALGDKYALELGTNAYAALNAMTEFASRPPTNRCVYRDRNSYQRLAGEWAADFQKACQKLGFVFNDYLAELAARRLGIQASAPNL
jgi:hypothetical protein